MSDRTAEEYYRQYKAAEQQQQKQSRTQRKAQQAQRTANISAKALVFAITTILAVVAIINMRPYISGFGLPFAESLPLPSAWVSDSEVAYWVVRVIGCAIGFLIWALMQLFQVVPMLVRNSKVFLGAMLQNAYNTPQIAISGNEDSVELRVKRAFNALAFFPYRWLWRASLFAYAVDCVICLWVYPPVEGNVLYLLFVFVTGQWQRIAWDNVITFFSAVFLFEFVIGVLLAVAGLISMVKEAFND